MSDSNLRYILSKNIKIHRAKLGISQEELADLCDLHRTYISDIERCTRNVSIDNIEKIANALNVSPEKLLEATANDNKQNL